VYRRTGGQPKPSISICPNCQQQKDPNSALCPNCNTRSCANGHILAPSAAVCSKCGWTDHHWKAPPKSYADAPAITYDHDEITPATAAAGSKCPLCGSRLDPKSAYCPVCGNLANAEMEFAGEEVFAPPAPRIQTPATPPPRVESYTVTQEVIGHKDTRRNYYCPRCQNKVDDPRPGRCPHCGYVGTMQYDIYQHQPQWTANQSAPAYSPAGKQQDFAQQKPPSKPAFEDESICPHCGASNPADSRFCRTCGQRYASGRLSRQVRSMSTQEWSAEAASALPPTLEPIYQGAEGGESSYTDAAMPKARGAPPRDKKAKQARVKEYGEKKFPLGLLMAIMIVVALIIALAIFVISKQFHGDTPPTIVSSDTTGPVISQINVESLTDSSAKITWVTDEPATSEVQYCWTGPNGADQCWTEDDSALVKNHTITLENTSEGISYHLTIISADQNGNETTSTRDQMFTGGTPTDTIAPAISAVLDSNPTDMGVLVTWQTDEPATSQVQYGKTQSYGTSTALDSTLVTDHSVLILGLDADTVYYYKVVSEDANGNENTYNDAQTYFKTLTAMTLGLSVENRAPDFTATDIDDNVIKLSNYRGNKIVMLNFWYTGCDPCVGEMPHIEDTYVTWSGNYPLEVIAVDIQDTKPVIESWLQGQSKQYTFPIIADTNGAVENTFSITQAPTTYFIDIQGIIKYKKEGNFTSMSEILAVLDDMD
jgi:peroxiredoxin/predicted amidophosphoribosyltransferase